MTQLQALPALAAFQPFLDPVDDEVRVADVAVDGALPPWLAGTLVRNGPAWFGEGDHEVRHLLDGLAMLHAFTFEDGHVGYANRFLRTKAYRAQREDGRIGYREFASDPCRRLAEPIASMFSPRMTDNASVNVIRLGEQLVALTETPVPIAFDLDTLETLGVAYEPPGRGPRSPTAHPLTDPRDGAMLNLQVHYGPRSSYRFYRRRADGRFDLVARAGAAEPSYEHSFAVTERHIVLVEQPLRLKPLKMVTSGRPFAENLEWEPERGCTFLVFDLASGALVARHEADPFFVFHHVNAYDDGDEIVVDLCAYEDAGIIDALYLDTLRSETSVVPTAELRRYRLVAGRPPVMTVLGDTPMEFPRINYRRNHARPYRYAYGVGASLVGGEPVSTIARVDVTDGDTQWWGAPDLFPGEPVFVPDPDGTAEDDGVLLSVVLDGGAGTSFLVVLDAHDVSELARAHAPHRIGFGFHGDFFRA